MAKRLGALPDFMLSKLVEYGSIASSHKKEELVRQVGPASVDLSLSSKVYRIEHLFLPRPREKIADLLKQLRPIDYDFSRPLERGITYVAKLRERLSLPDDIYGYCNPKSSMGRLDVHVRVLADGAPRYDAVTPAGFRGDLWVAITPNSFPVVIPEGECVSQLRLFNADTRLDETDMQIEFDGHGFLKARGEKQLEYRDLEIRDGDGSLLLTIDVRGGPDGLVGYECRGLNRPLDLTGGKATCDSEEFFHPIHSRDGMAHLEGGKFYILSTCEMPDIPPGYAAEVASMDDRSGEFRSHYAGFIDPGFKGILTLEIRPYHDIVFRHGQPVCKVKVERMIEPPEKHYGQKAEQNYQFQCGPKLSKYFKHL